jgi:hypothetical protein
MRVQVAVVLAVSFPAIALAQPATRTEEPPPRVADARTAPEMNGHVFLPSALVDTPFRETTFKLGLAYGFGTATGPRFIVSNGQVVQSGQADYSFADFGQTFRYEYRFAEWLSAGLVILTNLYSGIDGPSAVAVGAEIGIGAGLRVKAGHRFGPVETAIIVDVATTPQLSLLMAAAIARAIQDGVIDAGASLQAAHAGTFSPLATASWAPWPALGLTLNAGYVYKSLFLNGVNIAHQNGVQLAAMTDFDFGKISSVPIGVLAAYRLTAPVGDGGVDRIDDITGGIFYTAHRELGLGLEVGWRSFSIRPPLDSKVVLAQIGLQYYW